MRAITIATYFSSMDGEIRDIHIKYLLSGCYGDLDMEAKDKIYWLRAILALVAGMLCVSLGFYGEIGGRGIPVGVGFYILSYFLVRYYLKIDVNPEQGITVNTLLFNGVGTYILIWLFTWILFVNLLFF